MKISTDNINELKKIRLKHKKLLINLLSKSDYTCQELSDITKLSNVTIYSILDELLKNKCLTTKKGTAMVGRKPIYYKLNIHRGSFLVFDFTLPQFKIGVFDIKKNPLFFIQYDFNKPIDILELKEILNDVYNKIQNLYIQNQIIGIGVSIAGQIDKKTGNFIASSSFINSQSINISALINEYFKCPIYIKNNVYIALLANLDKYNIFTDNCLFLYLNNGNLGSCFMINGHICLGDNNFAGEIAQTRYNGHFIFPNLLSFEEERKYLSRINPKATYSDEEIINYFSTADEGLLKVISIKVKEFACLLNNYLAIIDCNYVFIDCNFLSNNTNLQDLFKKELRQLCSIYANTEIIFINQQNNDFIDGCLNYVINKILLK